MVLGEKTPMELSVGPYSYAKATRHPYYTQSKRIYPSPEHHNSATRQILREEKSTPPLNTQDKPAS